MYLFLSSDEPPDFAPGIQLKGLDRWQTGEDGVKICPHAPGRATLAAAKASLREVFLIHARRDRKANGFSVAANASYFTD
jgi:hypothetical protein